MTSRELTQNRKIGRILEEYKPKATIVETLVMEGGCYIEKGSFAFAGFTNPRPTPSAPERTEWCIKLMPPDRKRRYKLSFGYCNGIDSAKEQIKTNLAEFLKKNNATRVEEVWK
jgi:hypothetical protein